MRPNDLNQRHFPVLALPRLPRTPSPPARHLFAGGTRGSAIARSNTRRRVPDASGSKRGGGSVERADASEIFVRVAGVERNERLCRTARSSTPRDAHGNAPPRAGRRR
mmetsp:Transcript_27145/g.83348  ORF Transcript_27145/g.83348 Transcript_27145/m.83348 type:complete len:108 (+) Transcript_27145:354-677(+)